MITMSSSIKSIILSAGRSCFVRCLGCYNFFGKETELVPKETIIAFLKKVEGVRKVTVGGGDPISRPDLIPLLSQINELGFRIYMDTVGTAFTGETDTIFYGHHHVEQVDPIEVKKYVSLLGIALDGSTNEIMTKFRAGRENICEEQISLLERLDELGMPLCVNTLVNKHNIDDLENMYDRIKLLKSIVEWQLFQFMPIGQLGFTNRDNFIIKDHEFEEKMKNFVERAGKTHIKLTPKSRIERKGRYLLIDTDGNCWHPSISTLSAWDVDTDENRERIIIGNIINEADHDKVLRYIKGK